VLSLESVVDVLFAVGAKKPTVSHASRVPAMTVARHNTIQQHMVHIVFSFTRGIVIS